MLALIGLSLAITISATIAHAAAPGECTLPPVLAIDYHGTTDVTSDKDCTVEVLNRLAMEFGVEIAIVSAVPKVVPGHYFNMGLDKVAYQNSRILERDWNSPYNGGDEKASRIAQQLGDRCLLGIAGEEPDVEGRTAQLLGIPYFAIYQREKKTGDRWGSKRVKVCKHTESSVESPQPIYGKCPSGYYPVSKTIETWIPVTEPTLNMNRFREGSFYARNWCELGNHIVSLLKAEKFRSIKDVSIVSTPCAGFSGFTCATASKSH